LVALPTFSITVFPNRCAVAIWTLHTSILQHYHYSLSNAEKLLNQKRLLEALQLLQLNPLSANISAELAAGTRPQTSVLEIQVSEAKTFNS
jgi:hemolysin activation/secretion protein